MGSKRRFPYGTLGGFYGQELANQSDGNLELQNCFAMASQGPKQAPLPLLGRTTYDESFSTEKNWTPSLPRTPASVASHMHGAVCRGEDPARGAIIWDQPERLRPECLRGMSDKNISRGFYTGAEIVRSSHSHEAFRGRSASAVERNSSGPATTLGLPEKALFSSYATQTGRDFHVSNVLGPIAASKPMKTHIDDSSRVMGAQVPNRVRNMLFLRQSQSTGTINSLPSIVDVMPHSDLVRKLESANEGKPPALFV